METKKSIVRELESREREGKKTASVKLCGAPMSKEKIWRWKRETAMAAASQFDAGIGAWCGDSEMFDVEFVSEDEGRDETMESTGAAPVAGIGQDDGPPGSPHTITSANSQNQLSWGLDYQTSHEELDLSSLAIDRFERAWWWSDDPLGIDYNKMRFSNLPSIASVCGEPGVVEDTGDIDDDNNYTKNIDYSEDADYAKDTDHIEEDSDQDLITSLYRAVSGDEQGFVESLLNLAKQLGRPFGDSVLLNALKTASIRGHTAVMRLLLNSDIPTTNALREAAMAGRPEALPPLLDKAGCQPGALSFASRGRSECSQEDICRLLLDHGADVDEMSSEPGEPEWGPPLLEAAIHNNSGIFKLLLDRGASLDLAMKAQRNKRPWAKKSDFTCAKLDGGTNDTVLDATKALFLVLREGDSKLATILNLCYGANNNDALVIAARYGDKEVTKRLLDGGADPFQPNSGGLSAIEAAEKSQRQDLVKLLRRQSREPPHEMASLRECFALRARFISQCRNISDVAGRLPAHLAVEGEKLSRYFLDHRPTFRSAMSSMRSLSVLEAPGNVGSLLAYLCLARAMTDLIRSKAGTDFTGEFRDGILSFFDILKYDSFNSTNDTFLYEQVVRLAWGVELSQESSSAAGSVDENIRRMKHLAAKLLIQSTQFTDSEGISRADHHPLLEEHVAPGPITQAAKGSDPLSTFAAAACATQLPNTLRPDHSGALHNSATSASDPLDGRMDPELEQWEPKPTFH
ncbi:hypothetical protein CDV31_003944 [Fusarium ambrosium]|uniref:Uncharacterized protein n=1 Tax=Fusarium ambrosium TaxID=131363 RepID=A0A428USH4_9HYPO|nr:hypothetical protein CDV31_003944 [Fusarium ambrosium]